MSQLSSNFCTNCNTHNRPDGTFCRNCGAGLSVPGYQQSPAGYQQPGHPPPLPGYQQMPYGYQQPPMPASPPPIIIQQNVYAGPIAGRMPKSRATYILLGLFFGGLGMHNFYAGYSGRGVAQLLITLFLFWLIFPLFIIGIWILIEVIAVNTDAYGNPMS